MRGGRLRGVGVPVIRPSLSGPPTDGAAHPSRSYDVMTAPVATGPALPPRPGQGTRRSRGRHTQYTETHEYDHIPSVHRSA